MRTDFVKVTASTVLVPITIQIKNRDITFVTKDGVANGVVNILGKVTTLTHKTVQTFEDTVSVEQPAELLEKSPGPQVHLLEGCAAASGPVPAGHRHQGREQSRPHRRLWQELEVPKYHDEKLATSSLILADAITRSSSHDIGAGQLRDRQHQGLPAGELRTRPLRSTTSATRT